ncbi:MAG: asparagine synthase (glutamine-hydrolyzing) [Actinomycetota bacterium]|nr:asparagine synthase (glutamine-hydrolyzing) [Actinomycetota bacterium]
MCGIFGFAGRASRPDRDFLKKAVDSFSYRGPDDEGFYLNADSTVGLAHKRLSILDLSAAGHQPMSDESKTRWTVFNGEIYNFLEIKEDLEKDGARFSSTSDTEVLLYAYKKWGSQCVSRFNGMFAFGIYNSKRGKLFLARDRMGKKPLFYALAGGNLVFASELKAILSTGFVPFEVDPSALNFYFALGYAPNDKSMIRGVRKLPPGFSMEFDIASGKAEVKQYWDAPAFEGPHDEDRALEEIEEILVDSVKKRLMSDVPLGAFLSGGIDSSLVVAFMRRVHNGEIKTFSVGFEGSSKNELRYASLVARHFGTTHKEIMVKADMGDLERISGLLDEPIYDNSMLPTYYLCRHTRQDVTVALSGDGGDELFGGYIHYQSADTARRAGKFFFPPLNLLARAVSSRLREGAFGKNTLAGIGMGEKACFTYPTQIFREGERQRLLSTPPGKTELMAPRLFRESLMNAKNYDYINQMCYADIKTFMVDDILVKVDRASMFNSLEVRCPILDYRMAEYSFRHLPGVLKIRGGAKKYLLKKLAGKYLPAALDLERKQGFDIPGDTLGGNKSRVPQRLLDFGPNEFVSRPFIEALARDQISGRGHLWHKIFALYFFLRWLEACRG